MIRIASGRNGYPQEREQSLTTAFAILLRRLQAREIAKTRRLCSRVERLPGEGPRALQSIEAVERGAVAQHLCRGLRLMEVPPDGFRSSAWNHCGEGLSGSLLHVAQAAEVRDETLACLRANARDIQQF